LGTSAGGWKKTPRYPGNSERVSEFRINISNLPEGVHERSLEAAADHLGLDARFSEQVRAAAKVEKTSRQLYLHVEFTTRGTFTCDRCLDEFHKEVSGSYGVVYVTDTQADDGIEIDEIQVISPEANYIDLAEDVRQFVLLALPQKMLCREECAGLCPGCGVNRNRSKCSCPNEGIDPRWEGLRNLLEN